jgi:hypothetical protein
MKRGLKKRGLFNTRPGSRLLKPCTQPIPRILLLFREGALFRARGGGRGGEADLVRRGAFRTCATLHNPVHDRRYFSCWEAEVTLQCF